MLPPNYHKHPQINISLSVCLYTLSLSLSLLQLPPLPVIFGTGLALLISGWGLWTGERGIVEGGWVLSPAPRVFICLSQLGSSGNKIERERERGREGGSNRETDTERGREKSQGTGMKTVCSANKALKHLPVCPLLHWPTWHWRSQHYCEDHHLLSNQCKVYLHFN